LANGMNLSLLPLTSALENDETLFGNLSDPLEAEETNNCMYYLTPFSSSLTSPSEFNADASPHRDLNRLVLDYLILEGYRTAAESFVSEAATDLPSNAAQQVEDASIETRIQIKEKVESGDVMGAIEMCNDLNPEVSVFSTPFVGHRHRIVRCMRHS